MMVANNFTLKYPPSDNLIVVCAIIKDVNNIEIFFLTNPQEYFEYKTEPRL